MKIKMKSKIEKILSLPFVNLIVYWLWKYKLNEVCNISIVTLIVKYTSSLTDLLKAPKSSLFIFSTIDIFFSFLKQTLF